MNYSDKLNQMENSNDETDSQAQTLGQPLSDFLLQLEDYTPTVSLSFQHVIVTIANLYCYLDT